MSEPDGSYAFAEPLLSAQQAASLCLRGNIKFIGEFCRQVNQNMDGLNL